MRYFTKNAGPSPYEGSFSAFAICVVGAHSGGEVCVETGVVLHSPMQGTLMQLDVHGGGVVDAKAYKGWPGVVFNSKATTGLPHGGGSAMPLFSTMGATQITSRMSLLMSYWPMVFVLGATSEHRILLVYGRIPPSIRPYTWKYTAVYSEYPAKDLC